MIKFFVKFSTFMKLKRHVKQQEKMIKELDASLEALLLKIVDYKIDINAMKTTISSLKDRIDGVKN